MLVAKRLISEHDLITWCDSSKQVLEGALDALLIITEWSIFKAFSLKCLAKSLN